mmetsp:Transcript_39754/g.60934  ORF Transcript_39754/g.60934 Transcript_39754/m.60934 type:complete len:87 (-) Transcript_39754:2619-2879(-)
MTGQILKKERKLEEVKSSSVFKKSKKLYSRQQERSQSLNTDKRPKKVSHVQINLVQQVVDPSKKSQEEAKKNEVMASAKRAHDSYS